MELRKILIADDNMSIRKSLKFVLMRSNFEILEAVNGQDAVEKTLQHKPDIIIMDFKMPVLNGWDAARKIKSISALKDIPIIGYTAYASKDHIIEGIEAGCNEIIKKPIDIEILKKKIDNYIINSKNNKAIEGSNTPQA